MRIKIIASVANRKYCISYNLNNQNCKEMHAKVVSYFSTKYIYC